MSFANASVDSGASRALGQEAPVESPPETVYGTRKKLRLIERAIQEYDRARGLRAGAIRILDVGCGTGAMLTVPLGRAGYRTIGIDEDERSVRCGGQLRPRGVSFIAGNVLALQDKRLFDVVICSEVLEHLPDPALILAKCERLLRPAGRLLVTLPNGYGGFEWEEVLWNRCGFFVLDRVKQVYLAVRLRIRQRQFRRFFRRGPRPDDGVLGALNTLNPSPHLNFFRHRQVTALLSDAGFSVLAIENLSFLCGRVTQTLFGDWPWFIRWTIRMADRLPPSLCSNWLFVCERTGRSDSPRSAIG